MWVEVALPAPLDGDRPQLPKPGRAALLGHLTNFSGNETCTLW